MSLFLILPCSAVLIAMADPIVRLTCQRPDLYFDHAAVYRSSLALMLYSAGLAFYSVRQILVRGFYALGDYTFPVKVSAAMVALNLGLNLTLIHFPDLFRLWVPSYLQHWNLTASSFPGGIALGEAGLALATMLTAVADSAVLAVFLARRVRPTLAPSVWKGESTRLWHTAARMAFSAAALGVLTWLYRNSIPYEPDFYKLLERVLVPGVLACGTLYILAIIVPLPEMGEFLFSVFRRGKSRETQDK
jgi:putative peptidoglycan lipid II flippase